MQTKILADTVKRHGDSIAGVYFTLCTYLPAKMVVMCGTEIEGIVATLKQSNDIGEIVSRYADITLVGMLGVSSGLVTLAAEYLAVHYLGREEPIDRYQTKSYIKLDSDK